MRENDVGVTMDMSVMGLNSNYREGEDRSTRTI